MTLLPRSLHLIQLQVPLLAATFLLCSCASYVPPGPKADLQHLAPPDIQAGFAAKPSSPFPAGIAAVRLQGSGYSNHNLRAYGAKFTRGRYSAITTREVEEDADVARIAALPKVTGLIALNQMLLPPEIHGDRDLREAAARLQADLLLLYTFDTSFLDVDTSRPLSVITLGLSPTRRIAAATTTSALLLDTRTGYIYSAYEATERKDTLATSWNTRDTADAVRRDTERAAFRKLVDEFVSSWPRVLARHPPTATD